jgi:hypothetical protein
MKRYTYTKDIFELIQWKGDNFEEIEEFVKEAASGQSIIQYGDWLMLYKGKREYSVKKNDYIIKDIEYGECRVEDNKLFSFISEVEVKE